jgi:hypothetical protein
VGRRHLETGSGSDANIRIARVPALDDPLREDEAEVSRALDSLPTETFDVPDATEDDLIAIRGGRGTRRGYQELYSFLVERSDEYGSLIRR